MGHDGEEFRLGSTCCFRLETGFSLVGELLRALLGLLAIGDVAQRDDLNLLPVPLRLHHPQLGVNDGTAAALEDVDLGRLTDHCRESEGRAYQFLCGTIEQSLGGSIGEPNRPMGVDDDDPVGQSLDDRP